VVGVGEGGCCSVVELSLSNGFFLGGVFVLL
jgi:hypothetical protein